MQKVEVSGLDVPMISPHLIPEGGFQTWNEVNERWEIYEQPGKLYDRQYYTQSDI